MHSDGLMRFRPLRWLLVLTLSATLGCASVRGDTVARPIQSSFKRTAGASEEQTALGLIVSGEIVDGMSSTHFEQLALTFESRTTRWIRIVGVTLQFASGTVRDDQIQIPVGDDLGAWIDAAQRERAVSEHNAGVALGAVMLAGTAVASVGTSQRNGGLVAVGSAMTLGATAVGMARALEQARDTPGSVATVPVGHLLAGAIVVPPGMHAKRWVTLFCDRPNELHRITTVNITYRTDQNDTETVALTLRRSLPRRSPATATE